MGLLNFHLEEDKHTLVCLYAKGVGRLAATGNKMQGTLTLPDKTVFRRVRVQKEN